jgi:integration host factor subunit beta
MSGKKLSKAEIVESIYERAGVEKKDIRAVIENYVDVVKGALMEGKVIELRGFGTFEVRIRKGRKKARNPRTGELVSVSSHGIVSFRAGQELKREVWPITELPAAAVEGESE